MGFFAVDGVVVGLVIADVGCCVGFVLGLIYDGRVMGATGFVGITISTMTVSLSVSVSSNLIPSLSNMSAKSSKSSISSNTSRGSEKVVVAVAEVCVIPAVVAVVSETVPISVAVLAVVLWIVCEPLANVNLLQATSESSTGIHKRQTASFFIKKIPFIMF